MLALSNKWFLLTASCYDKYYVKPHTETRTSQSYKINDSTNSKIKTYFYYFDSYLSMKIKSCKLQPL